MSRMWGLLQLNYRVFEGAKFLKMVKLQRKLYNPENKNVALALSVIFVPSKLNHTENINRTYSETNTYYTPVVTSLN